MQEALDTKEPHSRHLAGLHPNYSPLELQESQAQLRLYFDLAWKIFVRQELQSSQPDLNLTLPKVNPMVKPPSGELT